MNVLLKHVKQRVRLEGTNLEGMTNFQKAVALGFIKAHRPFQNQKEYYRCSRKFRHPNLLSAILHIRHLMRYGRPSRRELTVYPCEYCRGLHVGRSGLRNELKDGKFEFARPS